MLVISGTINGIDYYLEIAKEARNQPVIKRKNLYFMGSNGTVGYVKKFEQQKVVPVWLVLDSEQKSTFDIMLGADSINCPNRLTFQFTNGRIFEDITIQGYMELQEYKERSGNYIYFVNVIEVAK